MSNVNGAARSRPDYRTPDCDLVLRYRNDGASSDLVVPVHLVCNTPDDVLIANINANSKVHRKWIGTEKLKNVPAIFCGSGPSLADSLGEIDEIRTRGGIVFAMNGATNFLAGKGVYADYQVICDAREATGDLVGPAKHHLFASQVHPSLFEKKPDAILFHVDIGLPAEELPTHDHEYVMVGSNGSVGNVALTLAYAMGYREFHVFGYDSSFRGNDSHAMSQPMNALEPITEVEYAGKKYTVTFTMKSAADVFPRLAYQMETLGCSFAVYGDGFVQDRWRGELAKTLEQREKDKYEAVWNLEAYDDMSPGLGQVEMAFKELGMQVGDTLLDFGCGPGRATLALTEKGIMAVGVDIATNCLQVDVPCIEACLWDLPKLSAKFGLCCDVLEHIPTEKVGDVIRGIARCTTDAVYFQICFVDDAFGMQIGQPLHLTIRKPEWWMGQLKAHFKKVIYMEQTPTNTQCGIFVCKH
jgi:2-polyprenyl-3-methyl-5-hydroxy-6-metoxy-1,4-benzoquinol methylase